MNRYQRLMRRIHSGERILIDGATGTEVERREVPRVKHAWNCGGALTHPDILRQIHMDYIDHGAEIVISNTFATSLHALRDAGIEDQFEFLNRHGVELAIEAREALDRSEVLVAGGMSCWTWTDNPPPLQELLDSASEQAAIMSQSGADLLMLEMMIDIDRTLVMLEAAQSSGLPVWVGFTCEVDSEGAVRLENGEPLADALAVMRERKVPLINIMHTDVGYIAPCLDVIETHWPGPTGVYAHTGQYNESGWILDDTISPENYADAAKRWMERGVQVIGGCCGIRVEHIEALYQLFKTAEKET